MKGLKIDTRTLYWYQAVYRYDVRWTTWYLVVTKQGRFQNNHAFVDYIYSYRILQTKQ